MKLETSGVVAFDAALEEEVLLVAPVLCVLSYNPRHSEIMNHAGTSAKMHCRICMVSKNLDKNNMIVLCFGHE